MRKGFNLFAAFLGTAMLLIAIGFSIYANQQRIQRSNQIALNLVTYDTRGVATVIKADAYNTVLNNIRKNFQAYFTATTITVPPEDLSSCSTAKHWFENEFAHSKQFAEWVANQMVAALQKYSVANIYGSKYTISVIVNKEELTKAIEDASTIKINDDGTFTYTIDTSKLNEEDYLSLPKIMVREELGSGVTGSTTDVVLPRGKWVVHAPLRVGRALCYASDVYNALKDKKNIVALAVGHCYDKNPAICSVFTGDNKMLFPDPNYKWNNMRRNVMKDTDFIVRSLEDGEAPIKGNIIDSCQYQRIRFLKDNQLDPNYNGDAVGGVQINNGDVLAAIKNALEVLRDYYQIVLSSSSGSEAGQQIDREDVQKKLQDVESCLAAINNCNNDRTCQINAITGEQCKNIVGELQWTPCGGTAEDAGIYLAVADQALERQLPSNLQNNGVTLTPDLDNYEQIKTAAEISRTGVNILKIVCQELTGTAQLVATAANLALKLLGIDESINADFCHNSSAAKNLFATTTVSYGPCTISNYLYCYAPKKYSIIMNWTDTDEKYRIDKEYPPTFHIRVILDERQPEITQRAQTMENKVNSITTPQPTQKDSHFTCKVMANLQSNLPQYVQSSMYGCITNYVYAYVAQRYGDSKSNKVQQCVEMLQLYGSKVNEGQQITNNDLPDFVKKYSVESSQCVGKVGKELLECWITANCGIHAGRSEYDKGTLATNQVADMCYTLEGLSIYVPGVHEKGAQDVETCYGPVTIVLGDQTYPNSYYCGPNATIEQSTSACPAGSIMAKTESGDTVCLVGEELLSESQWSSTYSCQQDGTEDGVPKYSCYPKTSKAGFCDTFYPKPSGLDKVKNWIEGHTKWLQGIVSLYEKACNGTCNELENSCRDNVWNTIKTAINPKTYMCAPACGAKQIKVNNFNEQLAFYTGSSLEDLTKQIEPKTCYKVQLKDGKTEMLCGAVKTTCDKGLPIQGGKICVTGGKPIDLKDGWSCTPAGPGIYSCINVGTTDKYCAGAGARSLYCTIVNNLPNNSPIRSMYIFPPEQQGMQQSAIPGLSTAAQCYPPLLGQQMVQMATMLVSGQVCRATPQDAVVYNTLWLHIGEEIYSSCSAGKQAP